jgi:hypothetical protein
MREQPSGMRRPSTSEGFLFFQSVIDQATVEAYRQTDYRVDCATPFVLRIGQFSVELLTAHKRHGVSCSAYVTACNPFSHGLDRLTNAARQAELENELLRRGLPYAGGTGQHPSNGWPGEDSFLVFGLTLDGAKELGCRHEQNAVIWSGADATPQLILLR